MKQYLNLCEKILTNGVWKGPARPGMPRTKSINSEIMKFDLCEGFPLLTTKKMFTKGIFVETLWMLSGSTNIHYLLKNNVHIWDGDGYKFFKKRFPTINWSKEQWIKHCTANEDEAGYMGNIYGYQWRHRDGIDQLKNVIEQIKKNPNSRYHIVEAWNPKDVVESKGALPPCHKQMQFFVRNVNGDNYLDLTFYCRSQDIPLGTPFNIAMYALILHLISLAVGMWPGTLTWIGGDIHIYENQIEAIKEQLQRTPKYLPQFLIPDEIEVEKYWDGDTFDLNGYLSQFSYDTFEIIDYDPYPAIKIPLSVGI